MDEKRRNFIKLAGISAAGVAWSVPVISAVYKAIKTTPHPRNLKADRWAMILDVQKCLQKGGCTACVQACNVVHNIPQFKNPKRQIKWIWKDSYAGAFPDEVHEYTDPAVRKRQVLVLCNHCDNAPCIRVCPTQATWKRKDGIVMMDMHRCIGCRYCMVACPYGARSFNWRDPRPFIPNIRKEFPTRMKGVVEKCNFCAERLAKGLDPACVVACRNKADGALVYGDMADKKMADRLKNRHSIRRKPNLGTKPHVFYLV
jgi:molybdopterin-containing oxidoreductase family iron-sulfur binding subunit